METVATTTTPTTFQRTSCVPEYLRRLYGRFYKISENIKKRNNRIPNEHELKELEDIINNAKPEVKDDSATRFYSYYYTFFKDFLGKTNADCTENFIKCITDSFNLNPLILWTSPVTMVNHFNMNGVIFIKYDRETKRFLVQRHMKKRTTTETTVNSSIMDIISNDHNVIED